MRLVHDITRLLIEFSDGVKLTILSAGSPEIPVGFRELVHGSWTGFYDWLRDQDGAVIGVRYWPFEEAAASVRRAQLGNLATISSRAVLLFFGDKKNYTEDLSADQAFEESRLLQHCRTGAVAFIFGCSDLTPSEQSMIYQNFQLAFKPPGD